MKYLIVYYSYSGNNEKLALKLKNKIGCEIFKIREKKKRKTISILLDFLFNRNPKLLKYEIDISKYDVIIFVAPIWCGKIASPIRTFIAKEKSNIKNYFYITLCSGLSGQKEKIEAELATICQRDSIYIEELRITNLLPKNNVKDTINYKVSEDDLINCDKDIDKFMEKIKNFKK